MKELNLLPYARRRFFDNTKEQRWLEARDASMASAILERFLFYLAPELGCLVVLPSVLALPSPAARPPFEVASVAEPLPVDVFDPEFPDPLLVDPP